MILEFVISVLIETSYEECLTCILACSLTGLQSKEVVCAGTTSSPCKELTLSSICIIVIPAQRLSTIANGRHRGVTCSSSCEKLKS